MAFQMHDERTPRGCGALWNFRLLVGGAPLLPLHVGEVVAHAVDVGTSAPTRTSLNRRLDPSRPRGGSPSVFTPVDILDPAGRLIAQARHEFEFGL